MRCAARWCVLQVDPTSAAYRAAASRSTALGIVVLVIVLVIVVLMVTKPF